MSVSRNTSRCVIAASILLLSSTTFISSALAQSVFSGGTLVISGEQTVSDDFDLLTSGTVQINSGGNATLTGNIVTNNNMLTFSTLGTGLVTGNINGGSSLIDKTGSGTLVIDGQISGVGTGISVRGTLVLNNANTFGGGSGSILLSNGTIVAGDNNALSTARITTTFATGTLSANKDVTLANNFSLNTDADLAVDTAGHQISLTGRIQANSGGGSAARLIKNGVGTLTLSGNNTYAGGTVLNQGTLSVSSDSNLGDVNGGLTFDGGELKFGSAFDLSTSRAINLSAGGGTIDMAGNESTIRRAISGSGGLTVKDSSNSANGTLTLEGMNDYTGATTIADGATLALSGQGRVNQSSGVQVDGTFDVSNASSAQINNLSGHGNVALGSNYLQINNAAGTFSGVISGVGGVNIGSGQQVFTGTNSYTGGTGIMAGAVLELGNGGTEGSVAGSITNYGAVVFNRSDDVLYNGEITGNGLFAHVGSGKLTLTTTSSSRGDVLIGPDSTLQLGSGGTTGHIGGTNFTGTIINLGTLIYDRSNAVSWKGIYAGNGEIIKEGTNTLTLTGDSSNYDGLTTVKRGKLIVGDALGNGKLGGDVTVSDGATLGGYGTLGSGAGSLVSIQSGGILSPGNSIGTLTINGDLTLQAGSFLMTELAGDGSADLVNVTGRANIVGSHLVITALDPEVSYQAGQKYNILSAGSLVSGQFADVTSNSAFLTFTLDPEQSLNAFNVALTPKTTEPEPNKPEPGEKPEPSPLFTTVANTNNQFATAQALDSLSQTGSSLALYNRLLMLSADEARAAYDNLSGEAYAAAKGALINQSQFINSAITNRLQQANGSTPTAPVATMNYVSEAKQSQAFDVVTPQTDTEDLYTGWGYAYGAWSEQDSTSNTGRMKSSVGGFVTGIDRLVYENWRLGLLAGYSHTSFNVDSRASSGSSDNYTLGAYTGTEWQLSNGNALAFSSGLAYTWHQIEMNRSVAFPAFGDNLNADYDAGTFQIFGELGYKIRLPKAVIEPYANLSYVRLGTDGFDEDGQTAAALSMNSDTMSTTFSTLGVRASTGFDLGTIPTTARADIGWRHASGDVNPVSTASFVGSNAFTVAGAPIAKDAAIIEAGLDFALSKDAILGVSYSGQFGSGAQRNGFNASLKVSF
ncbi:MULTISPECIES: autotransporter domain-containing protein [Brucella]|jgi:outer membrane autotransporter protein|uniref:autotransporter domain-containing protein n=1 Tax=Brucella anthropi TaxID=529 RepID=UPI0002FC0A58|nr:autotransporter domain-containing protein [Brucella anthropi]QOD66388.1 autotransporter domain-containing protein [Ochrobactrum sp. MT180101]QPA26223.1 autotransporter domain-containing protein [Brucella anthropi]QTN05750.1 autotransporter domain-containing protein [Ochrobactrum sp. EEELCW01]